MAKFDTAVKRDLDMNVEQVEVTTSYPLDDKFYYPPKPSKPLPHVPLKSHRLALDSYLRAEDSPMINALTRKDPPDFLRETRIKSISKRETIIYWISYLQKKLL
jgi:hypothetical protein